MSHAILAVCRNSAIAFLLLGSVAQASPYRTIEVVGHPGDGGIRLAYPGQYEDSYSYEYLDAETIVIDQNVEGPGPTGAVPTAMFFFEVPELPQYATAITAEVQFALVGFTGETPNRWIDVFMPGGRRRDTPVIRGSDLHYGSPMTDDDFPIQTKFLTAESGLGLHRQSVGAWLLYQDGGGDPRFPGSASGEPRYNYLPIRLNWGDPLYSDPDHADHPLPRVIGYEIATADHSDESLRPRLFVELFYKLPGDIDLDGSIGQSDLNIILEHWGQLGLGYSQGNIVDNDGDIYGNPKRIVGQSDLNVVLANWGNSVPPAFSAVPEPGGVWLLIAGVAMFIARLWWRSFPCCISSARSAASN